MPRFSTTTVALLASHREVCSVRMSQLPLGTRVLSGLIAPPCVVSVRPLCLQWPLVVVWLRSGVLALDSGHNYWHVLDVRVGDG